MFSHLVSALGGGVLGLVGHAVTEVFNIWQEREERKTSEQMQQTLSDEHVLEKSYDDEVELKIGKIKATNFIAFAAGLQILYHPVFSFLTFATVIMLFFIDIPNDKEYISQSMVVWCTMSMTWLFAASKSTRIGS